MRLNKLMVAVAALTVGAAAFAAPAASRVAVSSGASAFRANLKTALTNLCVNAGGSLTEFVSGSNISTYVCSTVAGLTAGAGGTYVSTPDANFRNFSGTSYAELRLNVAGGSFTAVQVLNGIADTYLNPATNATASGVPAGATLVGGLMDVEPEAFPATTLGSLTIPTSTGVGVAQTFGVAVSDALYSAMYTDQRSAGAATVAKPIPNSCGAAPGNTADPTCVPTISKGQMATIMNANEFASAKLLGAQFLAPSLPANTLLRYARRVNTSGTQASAQNYFLGLPCSTASLNVIPETATTYTNLQIIPAAGTGDVRTALNVAGLYTIGVMSGENNQASQGWKWLRVQGAPMAENATPASAGITNRASVTSGAYDFYFETKYVQNSAAGDAFWSTVSAELQGIAPQVGLMNATDLLGYNKNANACLANSSN